MFIRTNFDQSWQQPGQLADKLVCFNKKCYPILPPPLPLSAIPSKEQQQQQQLTKRISKTTCCFSASSQRSSSRSSSSFSVRSNSSHLRHSFIASKNLLQQNRILINYKKLTQFESFFLKNLTCLKKNFELIHAYLRASTKSSDLKLDSPDCNVKLRPKIEVSSAERRAFSEPVQSVLEHEFFITPSEKCKLLFRYSNSNNYTTGTKTEEFTKELHLKLVLNALCERNKSLFTTFETITSRLIKPLLSEQESETASSNRFSSSNQTSDLEQIEFSKSMIRFTLCLRKILNKIDQVTR